MSAFRIIILVLVVVVAVVQLIRRSRKSEDKPVIQGKTKSATCPRCDAEIEPGFLECWNCGGKFDKAAEGDKSGPR